MTTRYTRTTNGSASTATSPSSASPTTPRTQLGDIVFVELPEVGEEARQGRRGGRRRDRSRRRARSSRPIAGEVVEVNGALADEPALVNEDAGGRRLVPQDQARQRRRPRRADGREPPTRPSSRRSEPGAWPSTRLQGDGVLAARRGRLRQGPLLARPRLALRRRHRGAGLGLAAGRCRMPYSREDAVDPEEAFVASLSSCHMLTFIDLARRRRASSSTPTTTTPTGVMEQERRGQLLDLAGHACGRGSSSPATSSRARPSSPSCTIDAHEDCFIANSVQTEVVVEPAASA